MGVRTRKGGVLSLWRQQKELPKCGSVKAMNRATLSRAGPC